MIQRIIEWSLKNRFLVFCGALLLIALGVRAVFRTPVDAIPDLTENCKSQFLPRLSTTDNR